MTAALLALPSPKTKRCRTCGEMKDHSLFFAAKTNRGGLNNQCKACFSAACKRRYEANKTAVLDKCREYRLRNRDRIVARVRAKYADRTEAQKAEDRAKRLEWRLNNVEKKKADDKAWCEANRDRKTLADRRGWLRRERGITHEQYDALVNAQGGKCAICGGPPRGNSKKYFHVDHDHETGAVRGLLCFPCNASLGMLKDDTDLLRKAIQYLEAAPLLVRPKRTA